MVKIFFLNRRSIFASRPKRYKMNTLVVTPLVIHPVRAPRWAGQT